MKDKNFKTFHEHPDGTISIGRKTDQRLTAVEFMRLQALMTGVSWWGIVFPRPEDIINPSYVPFEDHAIFLENYKANPGAFIIIPKQETNND